MADGRTKTKQGTFAIRIASGKLFLASDVGAKVENFLPTEEGTLRSIEGPLPYLPSYSAVGVGAPTTYGTMHGIFHARVGRNGERDILLCQDGDKIKEFQGWSKSWAVLIGTGGAYVDDTFEDSTRPQFPTQFESTATGVVIVPQEGRAYFYDGTFVAPLGYSEAPGAPIGLGPESRLQTTAFEATPAADYLGVRVGMGVNDGGYAYDALPGRDSGMISSFRYGRIGFVVPPVNWATAYTSETDTSDNKLDAPTNRIHGDKASAMIGGWLEPGKWRGAVQWIDCWGNLSPLSSQSNEVTFEYQPATYWDWYTSVDGWCVSYVAKAEDVKKQVAWTGIDKGPERTIGRILYRTKDLLTSGVTDLYRLTQDTMASDVSFATLPDNVSTSYPDNIPDAWLLHTAIAIDPVPQFKLCRVAFGRLWIANTAGAPGLLRPSLPGRWGTFPANQEIYPDPSGDEVTGLWRSSIGLLAFSERSTFLVMPNDSGDGFRSTTISAETGCSAPSSIATLKDGSVIWLGKDGFYRIMGQEDYARGVEHVSADVELFVRRITTSRRKQATAAVDPNTGEYRCWVSLDGSKTNNFCFVFDGVGWRTRTDVEAAAVCTTRDHRNYMIAAGKHGALQGVWLLDHEQYRYQTEISTREATLETSWLTPGQSQERRTASTVYLWLRETTSSTVTVEVMRDWRNTVIETQTAKRYAGDDTPPFWGSAVLGATDTLWAKRRPYWTRVAIYVPSAEVFKFRIRGTGNWEFVGVQFDETPKYAGGARIAP